MGDGERDAFREAVAVVGAQRVVFRVPLTLGHQVKENDVVYLEESRGFDRRWIDQSDLESRTVIVDQELLKMALFYPQNGLNPNCHDQKRYGYGRNSLKDASSKAFKDRL